MLFETHFQIVLIYFQIGWSSLSNSFNIFSNSLKCYLKCIFKYYFQIVFKYLYFQIIFSNTDSFKDYLKIAREARRRKKNDYLKKYYLKVTFSTEISENKNYLKFSNSLGNFWNYLKISNSPEKFWNYLKISNSPGKFLDYLKISNSPRN